MKVTETFAIYRIEAQTADPGGIHYFSKVLFSTFTCVPSRIYSSVFQQGLAGRPCLPPSSIPSLSSIFPGLSFKDNCWNLQVVNRRLKLSISFTLSSILTILHEVKFCEFCS